MIGLMDCNNFFVSCERLFRPDLKGKPVAVLSSNDGCIVARSQEVKDLGIQMGAPYFQVKDQCTKHRVTLFSSNFTLYRDLSSRVMRALSEEFDHTEIYSIDEAFFEVPEGMTAEDIKMIRMRIAQKTGIPVSFGIASTKTIAKIANNEAKKGTGVTWLTMEAALARYGTITCGSVWGIGRQTSKRLSELKVVTVANFIDKGHAFARQEFGVVGERLYFELTGIRVEGDPDAEVKNASIMSTRSFHKAVTDKSVLMSALGHHVSQLGERLREREVMTSQLRILCAPSRFGPFALRATSKTHIFDIPTNDTTVLLQETQKLLDSLYEKDVPYKKAGAIVGGLVPAAYVAPSLFENLSREKSSGSVYVVVDELNERFGRGTIRPGVVMDTDAWAARSLSRSQEYTTQWTEIASVKAV